MSGTRERLSERKSDIHTIEEFRALYFPRLDDQRQSTDEDDARHFATDYVAEALKKVSRALREI